MMTGPARPIVQSIALAPHHVEAPTGATDLLHGALAPLLASIHMHQVMADREVARRAVDPEAPLIEGGMMEDTGDEQGLHPAATHPVERESQDLHLQGAGVTRGHLHL